MTKGDIVLVPFPFTDLTGSKNRPALVLAITGPDVVLAFLSTQTHWMEATDLVLDPSTGNGLKRRSLLRLSKIATLDADLVLGRLGRISKDEPGIVNVNLKKILALD